MEDTEKIFEELLKLQEKQKSLEEEKAEKQEKLETYIERVRNLNVIRCANGVSQKDLAKHVGIAKSYLSMIENFKRYCPDKLLEDLEIGCKELFIDNPLQVIFDYVRIRFPTQDVKDIIENVLKIRMECFTYENRAFYGYEGTYTCGNIVLMNAPNIDNYGVLLELKGKGCRQFEGMLDAQGRTWNEFFELVLSSDYNGIMKRIDLAVNDRAGYLNVPELAEKCKNGECASYFRKFNTQISGDIRHEDEEKRDEMGNTLYVGSFQSSIYFCIYEKDYEQYVKYGVPLDFADVKNRFEIRMKDERAQKTIEEFLRCENVGMVAFSIINKYFQVRKKDSKLKFESWKVDEGWQRFIGIDNWDIKLTVKPEPWSIDKSYKWLGKQVMPTLKLCVTVDDVKGTSVIRNMYNSAVLSADQLKSLEYICGSPNDFIIE